MSDKVEHLQMIQAVITRMAQNSFLLKGWTITLIAALFALASSKPSASLAAIAFVPAIGFWFLDAYYLRQERLFRQLYEQVRNGTETDFSMKTTPGPDVITGWRSVTFSTTLAAFYGFSLATIALALIGILIAS